MVLSVLVWPLWQARRLEQNRQRLFHAIRRNDTNTVRILLEAGTNANAHMPEPTPSGLLDLIKITLHLQPQSAREHGESALTAAVIQQGDPEIVRLLLAHGANATALEEGGIPLIAALSVASGQPDRAVIQLLLEHGANPNIHPPNSDGALFYALNIDGKDLNPLTTLLLEHGAYPLQPERDGRTYLTSEIWANHPKTVAAMLDHGANIDARDNDNMGNPSNKGTTPLAAAIASGKDATLVRLLLARGARIEQADREGLIRDAATWGDASLLNALIARGVGIDSTDRLGFTALMETARYGGRDKLRREMASMEMLLAHGASVRARNSTEQTPLIVACWYPEDLPKLKILLAHGADPNARDNHGSSVLLYASGLAGAASVSYLLAHGANARLVDEKGRTALMQAAEIEKGNPDAVAPLVAAGCDPNARDKRGRTALMLARLHHHTAVIQAPRKAGATH